MAEGRGNRKAGANSGKRRMQDEPVLGNDLTSDDEMDENYTAQNMSGNTVDPIERVAQLYHFLRSPQVDQTIRRFVASRKTRQLIAAGLSILEVVVIMLPLMKKLGGRVSDMTTLIKQPSHSRRSGAARSSGRSNSSRTLPAHTGSVN